LAPVQASIPRYCFDNDKYWYIIEAQMEDGRWWELSRYYHDFYDFQIALLSQFEEEAGNKGKPRTLPFMPGPVTHVTNAISNGRRQNLDEYIKKLLGMPPHISRCQLVKQLFAPRPGDFEIDPTMITDEDRISGGSHRSSAQDLSRTASRQSSQGQMSNYPSGGMRPPSSQRPSLHAQPSSSSQLNGAVTGSTTGAIKIKVFFQNEIIAIRVPSDIRFLQLMEKLKARLKVDDEIIIRYKDEPSGSFIELLSDNDLSRAIQRNVKLTLYVGLA
jgi:bud emergence protein 1